MKFYQWRSNVLRNYASGYVITAAESLEQAQKKAFCQFQQDFTSLFLHLFLDDEDDREEMEKIKNAFWKELNQEPEIFSIESAFLISGSD